METNNITFREFLKGELETRIKRNPRYSMRSFARFLEVDSSALSKMLNGKRPLGRRMTGKLGAKLGLTNEALAGFHASKVQTTQKASTSENPFGREEDPFQAGVIYGILLSEGPSSCDEILSGVYFSGQNIQGTLNQMQRRGLISKIGEKYLVPRDPSACYH